MDSGESRKTKAAARREATASRSDSIYVMNSKDMDAYIEQIEDVRKLFKTPSDRLHHLHARAESGVSFPPLSRGARHDIILLSSRPTKLDTVNKKAIPTIPMRVAVAAVLFGWGVEGHGAVD